MKRQTVVEIAVFVLLVALGAGSRIFFRDLPNFAPIAAMALFAGYFFRSWSVAVAVPLTAMVLSDLVIGGYQWQLMLTVYASLAAPTLARGILRRALRIERGRLGATCTALAGLFGCSLAASVFFFLTTNFAWTPWNTMYTHDWQGLLESYTAALPFFRHTLAGDAFFATLLFGSYAAAINLGWASEPQPAAEQA